MAAPTPCSQRPVLDGPRCSLPALPTLLADHGSAPCPALPSLQFPAASPAPRARAEAVGAHPSPSMSPLPGGNGAPSAPVPAEGSGGWLAVPGTRLLECQHTQHSGQAPRQEPCTDLRMARETFCFQGLSLRIPIPKPERKKSSPVVTRSHFWEASNSSTAESQMKAWSLLDTEGGWTGQAGQPSWAAATVGAARALPALI